MGLQIEVIQLGRGEQQYQALSFSQMLPWEPILPEEIAELSLPEALDLSQGVVLYGKPTWVFGRLMVLCREAPWVGCYNGPAGGIVVVHSQVASLEVGNLIPIQENASPCPAILIGGPPNSGKSVFSNALRSALVKAMPNCRTYLHRASWDGEGNWTYEANSPMVKQFVVHNEFRIHENPETAKLIPAYYQHHAEAVENLRMMSDCVLVDVGGMPQPEKVPLIEQCTHYIVISRLADAVEDWHKRCGGVAAPLAVIHSVLEDKQEILQRKPFLEIVAGPWVESGSVTFPECVLESCVEVYEKRAKEKS